MKKLVFTYSLSIIFLVSCLTVVSLFVWPIMEKVGAELEKIQSDYVALLEENVGISISYDSLSPSILSGLRIANIIIRDVENESSLISVGSIKLQWNILKLLGENPTDAFGKLVITGLSAEYNYLQHDGIVQKLIQATSTTNEMGAEQPVATDENNLEQEDIQEIIKNALKPIFALPIDVQLRNTSLSYSSDVMNVESILSVVEISDQGSEGQLNLNVNGVVRVESIGEAARFGELVTLVSLKGRITDILENSFAQCNISSVQESDYIIPRLDFHTFFSNSTFHAVAMQNVLPFSIEFISDLIAKQATFAFHAENFDLFDLVSYRGDNDVIKNLKGTELSGLYTINYNWGTEETDYVLNGQSILSPLLLGETVALDFSMYGDKDVFSIENFNIFSDTLSAEYSGSVNLQTFIPEGIFTIFSFTAPSGETLSSEVYIESLNNELIIFAPQVLLGEKSLTALQIEAERVNDTLNFTFEVSDYSRAETAEPGLMSANGSFDFGNDLFLQVELLSDSLFLASINEIALWYLPKEESQTLALLNESISPYIFSFDAFFSTDFSTFSYSLPYAIIANTQRDDEFLLFSANGNESLFQIPTLDMLIAGQSIQAEASGDLGDNDSEIFFNSSIYFNSLPYTFSGVYIPSEYLTVSGDYNFNLGLEFIDGLRFVATSQTQSLPISINDTLLSLSFDSDLTYNSPTDWIANIINFNVENISSTNILRPSLLVAGNISPNGAFFEQVAYSDDLSSLAGVLATSWNIDNSVLGNVTFNLSLEDTFSSEKYELNLEAFNLSGSSFSDNDFLENMFFSADALIQDSPSGRFANFQTETNTINARLTAQGSLANPSASLVVDNSSFQLGSYASEFSGSISLEDYAITANDVNIEYGEVGFQNLNGSVSLKDFNGNIDGFVFGSLSESSYFAEKTFASPIQITLESPLVSEQIPLSERLFNLNVVFEEITSPFLPPLKDYTIELVRTPGRFDLSAGINSEVTGYFLDSGEINLIASEGFFVTFEAFGIYDNNELTLVLDNIFADAQDFSKLVDLPVFSLHSGIATGTGTLTGPLSDLQINASLHGTNMEISVPDYVNERLICADMPVTVSQNVFSTENALFVSQETQAEVNLSVALSMEQLEFTYISLDIETLNNEYVLGRYGMPYGTFEGFAETDLELYITPDLVEVKGDINTKEVEAIITIIPSDSAVVEFGGDVIVDLFITVENQSQLYLPSKTNPIIRGLVSQEEPLIIQMNTQYGTSLISGNFTMRGGEILYLNRTFFAREASAEFYDSIETFDPRLTASAEIRERDENGDTVRILLSVENQPLSQLDPSFESVPAMSEQEIMTLLGQIIIGQSEDANPLALLGGLADYGTQIVVFRNVENQVRDLLNLDLFSFRTMFLQNAVGYALDNTGEEALAVGDFLDGTTIYIGKYLNETLYADALLSVVFDNDRQDLGLGGLVFQPEFGLELPSPFATIRWSIAPDLTTDWNLLVPYTSISFSWKFNL